MLFIFILNYYTYTLVQLTQACYSAFEPSGILVQCTVNMLTHGYIYILHIYVATVRQLTFYCTCNLCNKALLRINNGHYCMTYNVLPYMLRWQSLFNSRRRFPNFPQDPHERESSLHAVLGTKKNSVLGNERWRQERGGGGVAEKFATPPPVVLSPTLCVIQAGIRRIFAGHC